MSWKYLFAIIFIFFPSIIFAQHINYPLGNQFERIVSKQINISDNIIHTGFKPLMKSYVNKSADIENKVYQIGYDSVFISKMPVKWFWRKLLVEDFIVIERENVNIYFNPLINQEFGKLRGDDTTTYRINTRAFEIHGDLGKKLSFSTNFYENQAYFIDYIDEKIENSFVVPGQGAWKVFDERGRDYSNASGYISFTPADFFNLQVGHDKHFVGEGYRSLLLSDNSFNYPFLKLTFTYKKFQYVSMFTEFQEFHTKHYFYHYTKHGTFNYFSYSPHHKIQIGIFEGIIWRTSDDSSYVKKFNPNYFNPIMLIRPLQFGLNNEHNILLGLNLKIKPTKYTQIYGQFALDNIEFDKLSEGKGYFQNKYGYQVGAKIFDVFHSKIKKANLYLQAEYNFVRPFTYSHDIKRQNYSHYNQALSHPLGAGFKETIFIANLRFYNFFISYKYINSTSSTDTASTNFGSNIFLPNQTSTYGTHSFSNDIGQGNKTNISHSVYTFGYIFNERTNLQLFTSLLVRNYASEIENNETFYISFGIKTALNNYYYDY